MTAARARAVRIAESSAALGLIVMRLAVGASSPRWTDWMVAAAAAWLFCANAPPRCRMVSVVAQALMLLLGLLYLSCHVPYLWQAIGRGP